MVDIADILVQDDQPIAYGSRALSDVESRYSETERKALAVIWACEHFDIYVSGSSFTVVTDQAISSVANFSMVAQAPAL